MVAALATLPNVEVAATSRRSRPKFLSVASKDIPPTGRLTERQVADLVYAARDAYGRNETPRIELPDPVVNDLANRARGGDELARELVLYWGNRLIAPHPQHIHWIKYSDVGPEDMWQEGRLVLLTAINKYDGGRGHDFGAYAARVVSNALGEWAERHSLVVTVPRHARRRLRREGVVDETTRRAKIAEALPRYLSTIISTPDSDHLPSDDYSDNMPERADPFNLEESVVGAELAARIRTAYNALDPLFRRVLYHRFVLELSLERAHRALRIGMGTLRGLEDEALAAMQSGLEEYLSDDPDAEE